ncbi:MAG: glycosyl hydrolase family 18 protein [Eubacterium sp.]|nr:glycosyl hydrolase family 18 protein [Eubacterium sp.]
MDIYVVKEGDTIDAIASAYRTTPEEISYANQIPYPYRLAVGQALLLESGTSLRTGRSAVANGYAYPYISPWVLRQTLPYLTGMFVFSYGFTVEGELLSPVPSDAWMLETAAEFGRDSILTLTPLGPDGRFSNNLIHGMLENEEGKERLMEELLAEMRRSSFSGVDVDFEYILAEDRDLFTGFVAELTRRMNAEGYRVSVALAPKTSADQPGLLYEGKDYRGLGEAANEVLLMTYEWGYKYGPPMAVAPLNKVRQVVEYALTEIPPEKILLGVPNYGYDWILPFVRGESQAVTIGHVEAVQIAINNGVPIQYDETAQSPFFLYERDGVMHEVWFEDVRSLERKYDLIREFGLRGMGVWQIMRLFRAMWLLYEDVFEIS